MSTNSECHFIQVRQDQWFYILEHRNAPKNSWDWREHATGYGPFQSEDQADDHLRRYHANPGGSETYSLPAGKTELDLSGDEVLRRLIEEAPSHTRR